MCNYSNSSELFSRLTLKIKQLSKQLLINNLDVNEELQQDNTMLFSGKIHTIMRSMVQSFELSQDDFTTIYMKLLNNGVSQERALSELKGYIPEEERENFESKAISLNIYPNPKYFWLTDEDLKRIRIDRGENRKTIKSKIQADGRCFTTKIKTDMYGTSKDGKKIIVNNLSKWLFGVPGAKGNLTVTRSGDYIQLPRNTPDEAIELIESVLYEKEVDENTK